MIDEILLQRMCKQYNIKYKIFESTDTITLYTGLDDWMIKYVPGRDRPYCIFHKNKIKQTKKYHVQRWVRTLYQGLDVIITHKKVLVNVFSLRNTYKNKNIKINSKYKNNKKKGLSC